MECLCRISGSLDWSLQIQTWKLLSIQAGALPSPRLTFSISLGLYYVQSGAGSAGFHIRVCSAKITLNGNLRAKTGLIFPNSILKQIELWLALHVLLESNNNLKMKTSICLEELLKCLIWNALQRQITRTVILNCLLSFLLWGWMVRFRKHVHLYFGRNLQVIILGDVRSEDMGLVEVCSTRVVEKHALYKNKLNIIDFR